MDRTLDLLIGRDAIRSYELNEGLGRGDIQGLKQSDFGAVVAATCLCHDIGNPPFGHAGEDAIRDWFIHSEGASFLSDADATEQQRNDLVRFNGNAQGFRVLSRLPVWKGQGGLQLTCATLGAYSKYPNTSTVGDEANIYKKFGYFSDDQELFHTVARQWNLEPLPWGLKGWCRHPLAYLVEAADDIC